MLPRLLLPAALALAATLGSLGGCQGCGATPPIAEDEAQPSEPSVRLYLMSTVAGALEPCGCSKDQLGGLDHVAAFLKSQREPAQKRLVLAAGPLLFLEPKLEGDNAAQDRWKAESIADAMHDIELRAWAPGANDWADGAAGLTKLAQRAGASLLGAGLSGDGVQKSQLYEVGGLKVGVVGLSDPRGRLGGYPSGVAAPRPALEVVKEELAALRGKGAELLVVLAAMPRGEALRMVEGADMHILVLGRASAEGHANSEQPPPELINGTLVVETANHAQAVAVVDVFWTGKDTQKLADGSGVAKAAQIADVSRRIRELEARINSWNKGGKVDAADLEARKKDLEKLEAERKALGEETPAPKGSFFRYRVEEVREGLGEDDSVAKRILDYYQRVNEHNKVAFADRVPAAVKEGQAGFIGVEECTGCHAEAREVWDKTAHAKAYDTLEKGHKEFNLDCVGCHVTGYLKPGGSTVTHNDKLRDVQCEDCHGPGSLHAKDPEKADLITLKPDPQSCVTRCHHPPHVEGFDAVSKMDLVLGPGHGK
jgi:2',3'-cyclic-nucleotide 2'-phosphodiesterase (5'-nucleotidase family)